MAFKYHEDFEKIKKLLIGRQIVDTVISAKKVLLKFDNQDWFEVEIDTLNLMLTSMFTEWTDDS
jgi:hypothetical protein